MKACGERSRTACGEQLVPMTVGYYVNYDEKGWEWVEKTLVNDKGMKGEIRGGISNGEEFEATVKMVRGLGLLSKGE